MCFPSPLIFGFWNHKTPSSPKRRGIIAMCPIGLPGKANLDGMIYE